MMKSIIDDTLPFASEGKTQGIEKDQVAHYDAWKANPTNATRSVLLKSVQPVIDKAIYTYAGAKPAPTVKSQAKLLAMKAFDTYDPAKGTMKNHLMGQLRGLQRYAGQQNQIIAVPERVVLDKRNLTEAEEALRDRLGRDPSDMEIANYTGLSLKRINYVRNASSGVASGSMLDEEGEVYSPASNIPGVNTVDAGMRNMIYYDLNDIDQVVMDYTLGMHGSPQLETNEIAARLGISPSAVSQRKAKIQAMLDEAWAMNLLGGE